MSGFEISQTNPCAAQVAFDIQFCKETGLIYPEAANVENRLIDRQGSIGILVCHFGNCEKNCAIKVEEDKTLRHALSATEVWSNCMLEQGGRDLST